VSGGVSVLQVRHSVPLSATSLVERLLLRLLALHRIRNRDTNVNVLGSHKLLVFSRLRRAQLLMACAPVLGGLPRKRHGKKGKEDAGFARDGRDARGPSACLSPSPLQGAFPS